MSCFWRTFNCDIFRKYVAKGRIRCFSTRTSSSLSPTEMNGAPGCVSETPQKRSVASKAGAGTTAQIQKSAADSSVYLALCADEQRLKISQAIAVTQAAWKQKVRVKDWRAGQKPVFYDGPAWFKFWLKKKRPGARG